MPWLLPWFASLALLVAIPASAQSDYASALDAATRDLCERRVALLGEGATHGDGATLAFKAELVQRLVTQCGYRALFFEGSHYDFLAFERALRHNDATQEMLGSAIGGLWRHDREVASLVPFLFERARAGQLMLGGIDNNLGSAGAFYSLDVMPGELAEYLAPERRTMCREAMRRRIFYERDIRRERKANCSHVYLMCGHGRTKKSSRWQPVSRGSSSRI